LRTRIRIHKNKLQLTNNKSMKILYQVCNKQMAQTQKIYHLQKIVSNNSKQIMNIRSKIKQQKNRIRFLKTI
jgi:hypothetical protein